MPLFESVAWPRYPLIQQRKDPAVTAFLHRSRPGESPSTSLPGPVRAAAVWEPSGFHEPAASVRVVRTLRRVDRTQGREENEGQWEHVARAQGRHWRETGLTYLLGALLGLAVVSASLLGAGDEPAPGSPGYPADSGSWTVQQAR